MQNKTAILQALLNPVLYCGLLTVLFFILVLCILIFYHFKKRRMEKLNCIDPLTGVPTLQKFLLDAQERLRDKRRRYACIYADILKFSLLNETLGRKEGDALLRYIAVQFHTFLRPGETMCRLSADQFILWVIFDSEKMLNTRLIQWNRLFQRYKSTQQGHLVPVTIAYGIFLVEGENRALDLPIMIDRAHLAQLAAKKQSTLELRCVYFGRHMQTKILREKQLEDRMWNSLRQEEFKVYLQPKYDCHTQKITGAEALARWENKEEGLIPPSEFIDVFETNGFIIQLDLYMFDKICALLEKWFLAGKTPPLLSVNLSRVHLAHKNSIRNHVEIFNRYQIPPSCIEFEITESLALAHFVECKELIDQIHQLGFSCSIDDFGSGYSSLGLIKSFQVDTLKIDRSFFTYSKEEAAKAQAVIRAVLSLAQELKMETVAEGVETMEQITLLQQAGCNYVQGFVLAKPMPVAEFETLYFGAPVASLIP